MLRKSPNNVTRASQFWLAQKALFKQHPNYPNVSSYQLEVMCNVFTENQRRSQLDLVFPLPLQTARVDNREPVVLKESSVCSCFGYCLQDS